MKPGRRGILWVSIFALLACGFLPPRAFGLTPMEYGYSLIAGGDAKGFADGPFETARFNNPVGLAFDDQGTRLFVADTFNQRIRVVYLGEQNRVETLAGTGQAGKQDGAFSKASFNQPTDLAALPGNRLLVYDMGDDAIRLLDLNADTVTTLGLSDDGKTPTGPGGGVWSMAFFPGDGGVYLSEPEAQAVQRLDLASQKFSTLLRQDPRLPAPAAMCVDKDKLYIADKNSADVYAAQPVTAKGASAATLMLTKAGSGDHILALASSGGCLYALQIGGACLIRLLPDNRPVELSTPWGFFIDNSTPWVRSFFRFDNGQPVGFVPSPREPGKLYISRPVPSTQSILSVKDGSANADAALQASPPPAPLATPGPVQNQPKTFRILVVGDSQTLAMPQVIPTEAMPTPAGTHTPSPTPTLPASRKNLVFPKQLEFLLNLNASLQGSDVHFEVDARGYPAESFPSSARNEVPALVSRDNIDLIIAMVSNSQIKGSMESVGQPFSEMAQKIQVSSKGVGHPALLLCFVPFDGTGVDPDSRVSQPGPPSTEGPSAFWKDLCGRNKLDFLDLGGAWDAFKTAFYPTRGTRHDLTAYGNSLAAYLLDQSLESGKWVPAGASPNPASSGGPLDSSSPAPLEAYNSLVAGGVEPGDRDGDFSNSRFNYPAALAFDDDGGRLFVADQDNHRIKVVYLNEENRVATLAGTGQPGAADGPLTLASFNRPSALAWLPGQRLAVYDGGDHLLRLVDLKAQTVATLAGNKKETALGDVWNLAYLASEDALYFSEPVSQDLRKLDMKSNVLSTALSPVSLLPHPMALCAANGRLYAADRDLPTVYKLESPASSGKDAGAAVSWSPAGQGDHIREMAFSDGVLYAFQRGEPPLLRLDPAGPVSLASPWGFTLADDDPGYEPLLKIGDDPVGFAALPGDWRKLFISCPRPKDHSILSVEDYEFDKYWLGHAQQKIAENMLLTDFHYPPAKPPKTVRILVVGSSSMLCGDTFWQGEEGTPDWMEHSKRVLVFPKELESLLNLQSALHHSGTHYEVLSLGYPGKSVQFFPYYEVPPLVQRYGIDHVFFFACPYNTDLSDAYTEYYLKPWDKDGVPVREDQPEYFLKPYAQRIGTGTGTPGDLFKRCMAKGIFKSSSPMQVSFPPYEVVLRSDDPDIHKDLVQMSELPIKLLGENLAKGGPGARADLSIFYVPYGESDPEGKEKYQALWTEVASDSHLPFLDLSDDYNALKESFYPTQDACCHEHLTAYGNILIADLLAHSLPDSWLAPVNKQEPAKETPTPGK